MGRHKVVNWIRRYLSEGIDGLEDKRRLNGHWQRQPGQGGRRKMFQYPAGTVVYWAEVPAQPWVIRWHRITYRHTLAPVIEVGLGAADQPGGALAWAYEPDVLRWEERPWQVRVAGGADTSRPS